MEDFVEFVKTIKRKVHDWWISFESKHVWTARLIVYSSGLAGVVLVCFSLFRHFNLFHTDVTSARYMLSALVQSQAAIVAIVITLTLIAVQLTASAYSPRVIDIFKKNPDMWLLLGCYGVSIFYGFMVLKLVESAEGGVVSQSAIWSFGFVSISFECCVSLAYWFGAFTFVALFPYMWNIISLLKSENIINRLANEITRDKILNPKEAPVQPILDILHGSIMKYDLETTRIGLKAVTDQVIKIIDSDAEKEISERFCNHLMRVGKLAISREDEESNLEVIVNLEDFAKSAAEKGVAGATVFVASSLGEVGKAAAEKGLAGATQSAAFSLGRVGEAAAEKGLGDATRSAAFSLGLVGKVAARKGLADATQSAAWSLGRVGKVAAEKGLAGATWHAAFLLGLVGEAAARKGLAGATVFVASLLGKVGKAAAEKGLADATQRSAWSLGLVGKAAAEKGLADATQRSAWSLGLVGKAAAEKGLEDATEQATRSLAELTILSEEVVKIAIQDYESKLEEKDRDSFQKFMERYRQELEKLRAEKRTANIL